MPSDLLRGIFSGFSKLFSRHHFRISVQRILTISICALAIGQSAIAAPASALCATPNFTHRSNVLSHRTFEEVGPNSIDASPAQLVIVSLDTSSQRQNSKLHVSHDTDLTERSAERLFHRRIAPVSADDFH